MINYLLADCVSRLDIAIRGRKKSIIVNRSFFIMRFLDALRRHGCILYYYITIWKSIIVRLKYWYNVSIYDKISLVSTPGMRKFKGLDKIILKNDILGGFFILSTWCGLVTSLEIILIRKLYKGKMGGEILCYVLL